MIGHGLVPEFVVDRDGTALDHNLVGLDFDRLICQVIAAGRRQ
jgi:hypothetical protein